MRLEQRVTRLEMAAKGSRDSGDAELLSPRDVCFLIAEQQRLMEENTCESKTLASLIDGMLESHQRAIELHRFTPMAPEQADAAAREAAGHDDADGERFRLKWMERLEAERETIREVFAELDSLKG